MACSYDVYRTPPTKTRPALSLETYLSPTGDRPSSSSPPVPPSWCKEMAAPMMTANGVHRRPSLFDISNITPPPTKVSHFSDPLSTPVNECFEADVSSTTPPPAPRSSSRKDRSSAGAIDIDMGRALFISSPQPRRQDHASFLTFSSLSPFTPNSDQDAESFYSTQQTPEVHHSSPSLCDWKPHNSDSPASPILHITLGTTASGAARPMVQPRMPGLPHPNHQPRRHYDFDARAMGLRLDHFFGESVLQAKVERGGYGKVGIARTNAGWDRQPDFEPLLANPSSPSARRYSHPHPHHPYAHRQSKTSRKRKHRPPPLNLTGISAKVTSEATCMPRSKRRRPSLPLLDHFGSHQPESKTVVHPVDAAIQSRLLPSLMPAGSGLKRKMSFKNMLHLPSRLCAAAAAHRNKA